MPAPLISFCIATFNRGPILIDCLHRLANNGLPASHFEILVVDNASTDNTPALLEKHCPTVRVLRQSENRGPVAKNLAIHAAQGQYIVLLDDDAYPHPGSVARMLHHFQDNPRLAAAVFDVTLPDGSKEGSAYPDVFIGAGTGLRRSALDSLPGGLASGPLPDRFFMQAEEYDLSFRLLHAGWSIQRFWDMPLTHLKSPNARIGQRTTYLDVRNNLHLLARYIPAPLCDELAADWTARYSRMATQRDQRDPPDSTHGTHRQAFQNGAAEGLEKWTHERDNQSHLLTSQALEQIFKTATIQQRLARAMHAATNQKIIFAELGKNILAYWKAAQQLGIEVLAIGDENLGAISDQYRAAPLRKWSQIPQKDLQNSTIILTNMSRVHAPSRAAALRRSLGLPVIDLFARHANSPPIGQLSS